MRNDWPWIGLTAGVGVAIVSYLRVLFGFADGRMDTWPAFWMGGLIAFVMLEIAGQVRWKSIATEVADDAWSRPVSDEASRAKLCYVVALFSLYAVIMGFGAILILDPNHAGEILPKSAGGIVMARTCLIFARRTGGELRQSEQLRPE